MSSGVASAMKSSTPASAAMAAAVMRIVAGHHDGPDSHCAQVGETLLDPWLDDILEMHRRPAAVVVGNGQRRAAGPRNRLDRPAKLDWDAFLGYANSGEDCIDGALAQRTAGDIDAGDSCLRRERHNRHFGDISWRMNAVARLRKRDDGPSLRRLVSERRQKHRLRELALVYARDRDELVSHPVAEGDRASLVQQQRVDVASRFHRSAGGGDDIETDQAVHACDADGGQQSADRRRNETDEQSDKDADRQSGSRIGRERPERHADDQENDREARQQDRQRQFVWRLLPLRAFDQRNHAVDEGGAGLRCHASL